MAKLYSNLVNFIASMDMILKIVFVALMLLLVTMAIIKVVKVHTKDKPGVKYSLILLLILLVLITV